MDYDQLRQQRNTLKIGIFILTLTVLMLILYFVFFTPRYKDFSAQKTVFNGASFAEIIEESIYSYNQIAFTKTDVASGETRSLNNGARLPWIDKLFWGGDTGVILTFSEAGATESLLSNELTARNLEVDDRVMGFVWYFDFKTSKLSLVSEQPLLSDTVHFNPEQGSFYLHVQKTREANEEYLPHTILRFETATGAKSTVKTLDVGEGVAVIDNCYDKTTVCYVATKDDSTYLMRIGDNTAATLSGTYESIQPTYNPSIYIGYSRNDNKNNPDDDAMSTSKLTIIDLATKSEAAMPIVVATGSHPIINMVDEAFFVFTSSLKDDSQTYYKIGKRLAGGYASTETKLAGANEQIAPIRVSYGKNGVSLAQDIDGGVYLIAPKDSTARVTKEVSQPLEDLYKGCINDSISVFEHYPDSKQLRVGVVFDQDFTLNQRKFTDCIVATNIDAMLGQKFTIIGTDPVTGRYSTN